MNRPTETDEKNQGEGNKVSARAYNKNVREFVASGEVEDAAAAARAAVESDGNITAQPQGEGDIRSANAYNQKATDFASSGKVKPAAERAKRAVDEAPNLHAHAEAASRAKETDPDLTQPEGQVEDEIRSDDES